MTQGRDGISLAHARALQFARLARQLSFVAATFLIAALVMGTAGTSYAKSKHSPASTRLLDTVVVANNGGLFAGNLETFLAGAGHNAAPRFLIHGTNSLLGASTGPTGDAVSSLNGDIAVALPTDFLGETAVLEPPVGCGPFGVPATGPLFGTGLVEIFGPSSNGNSAPENVICSPNFSIGEDGQGLAPGFPNTTGIFFPQGVAFENPFDDFTPPGHEILAVANLFPEVIQDSPLGACAPVPPSTTPGASLGTITLYDKNTLKPGLDNVPPFNNNPVLAINPFPAMGVPPINPPIGVIYEQNATIGGCLSLLAGPVSLAFDPFGFLFAVNNAGMFSAVLAAAPRFVTVYAPPLGGDEFPSAVIGFAGATAGTLLEPVAVTVLSFGVEDDLMFVTDAGDNSVKIFDVFVNPNLAVGFADTGELIGTIKGSTTKLKHPLGAVLSPDGDTLYVTNNNANSLEMFTDVPTIIEEEGGDIAPTLIIQSRSSKMNLPVGVALPAFTPTPMPSESISSIGAP